MKTTKARIGLTRTQALAVLGLLSTTVVWGSAFVFMKNTLDVITPMYLLAFRFTIAAAFLFAALLPKIRKLRAGDWKAGALLGFWLTASYVTQTYGLNYTTASNNAFLTTIYVIIVPFLHVAFNKARLHRAHLVAAAAAFGGIALLSLNFGGDPGLAAGAGAAASGAAAYGAAASASGATAAAATTAYPTLLFGLRVGDALTILCGICFSVHIMFLGRHARDRDPATLSAVQFATTAALCWAAAPIVEGAPPFAALQSTAGFNMLYLGLVCTLFCFLMQAIGQRYLPETLTSILIAFECVFGAAFSIGLLGDPLTPRIFAGFVLLLGAALLSVAKAQASS